MYKISWNTRFLETNCSEIMQKQSLIFKYNFNASSPLLNGLVRAFLWHELPERSEDKSQLFKGFFFNPENYAYLKVAAKQRQNKVGSKHSSALLLERAVGEDSIKQVKLGVRFGQVSTQMMARHFAANASTELISGTSLSLWKSKFFLRHTTPLTNDANFELQTNLYGGLLQNLGEGAVRVNDAFYLQNFKGIRNIGYYFDPSENEKNKIGLAGDVLGFDKYLGAGLRINQNFCPLLQNIDIDPFVFINVALAPNRNAINHAEKTLTEKLRESLRVSSGFGLSMKLNQVAIECLYSVYVSRQKNELRNDFQINFGLD